MAVKKTMTVQQEQQFEQELLQVLRNDPEHQLAFDGKLRVFSTRYNCFLEAVNVHWDQEKGNIVFVGAFLKGEPHFDTSKGYPVIAPELSLTFKECFDDLCRMPGFSGTYLVSKTRKAAMDKYVSYPMRLMKNVNATEDDTLSFCDFDIPDVKLEDRWQRSLAYVRREIDSDSSERFTFIGNDRCPVNPSKLSLLDVQRIGETILKAHDLISEARKVFVAKRTEMLPANATVDERMNREADLAGLDLLCKKGYPTKVCYSVSQTYCCEFSALFGGERLLTSKELNEKIRLFREKGWNASRVKNSPMSVN